MFICKAPSLSRSAILRRAAALMLAITSVAHAQSTAVIPPSTEATAGNIGDAMGIGNQLHAVYQVIYGADQLGAIPSGSVITGMQVRLDNSATTDYPSAGLTINRFDIKLGSSTRTPATRSATFADNIVNPVLVRSGPLQLAANAYPSGASGSTPEGWGPLIPFSTGYVYRGGPLVLEQRVEGPQEAIIAHYAEYLEDPTKVSDGLNRSSADATVADELYNSGLVVRLTFTPPPVDLAQGVTKVTVGDAFVSALGSIGVNTPLRDVPRTQVSVINANQFDTIGPGSDFVGMSHRLNGSSPAWPMAAATFARFSIDLSRSTTAPGSLSTTVASNVGTDSVSVRSGPLTIPIGSLQRRAPQSTAPFSWEIPFAQPYSYRGGPLLTLMSHSGQSGSAIDLVDAESSPASGYGTVFQALVAGSENAAITAATNPFSITRYSVDAGTSSPLNQLAPAPGGFPADLSNRLQWIISADELRYIPVGSVIDSLWLRQRAAELTAAPGVDSSALDFEIALSTATVSPGSMSNTFADNQGADRVVVHDGPLGIAANTLPPGTKGTFGKIAQFQRQFVYKGGPLCIDIRHSELSTFIGTLDAVQNTTNTNRMLISGNPDADTGLFFGGNYRGIAVKLGYIPSVISPNNLATGVSFDPWILSQISNYAVQFIVPASQLRSIDVGSTITGLSLRRATTLSTSSAAFPPSSVTVPRFDVSISTALNPPELMSSTFSENIDMDNVLARSGPLTIPANAFPACGIAGAPNDNAWYVSFDRGFVYQGGNLCVTIRGQGVIDPAGLFEGSEGSPAEIGNAVYNYGDDNGTGGSYYSPLALRFAFTPRAFCPADLNNDGQVDDADFSQFVVAYNILDCADPAMPAGCPADLNRDGLVEDADFSIFVVAYNELLCP